jgi:hypothetical protein
MIWETDLPETGKALSKARLFARDSLRYGFLTPEDYRVVSEALKKLDVALSDAARTALQIRERSQGQLF